VLTIYKNHPVGNFRLKHYTIDSDVAGEGEGIAIRYIHISYGDWTSRKIASPQITDHIYWSSPKWNGANHLIFKLEFPVFPCKW